MYVCAIVTTKLKMELINTGLEVYEMASIFEAESRGKEKDEDVLTSRVFGIFKIVDKSLVLGKFLENVGIKIPKKEIEGARIRLWEKHGECIPDVVIQTKSSLIFVESKLDSPLSSEQLKTEYTQGDGESESFYLLCVTKHFDPPEEIEILKKQLKTDRLFWTSWQSLYTYLLPIEESTELDKTSKALIGDLRALLEAERLRGFSGFKDVDYEKITSTYENFDSFSNEMSIFIQELASQLSRHDIELKRTGMTTFDRDGRGTSFDDPEEWITSYYSFAFGKKVWPFKRFWRDNYLFVRFYLNEPIIWIGYRLRPNDQPSHRKLLIDEKDWILAYLKDNKDIHVSLDEGEQILEVGDLPQDLFTTEELKTHWEFAFIYEVPSDEITKRKLLPTVRKRLLSLSEMVSELDLVPKKVEEEVEEEEEGEGEN